MTTGDRALIQRLVLGHSVITRSGAAVVWAVASQQDGVRLSVRLSVQLRARKLRGG